MLMGDRYFRPLRNGHLAPPCHWYFAPLGHGDPAPFGDINLAPLSNGYLAPLSDWDPRSRWSTSSRLVRLLVTRLVH